MKKMNIFSLCLIGIIGNTDAQINQVDGQMFTTIRLESVSGPSDTSTINGVFCRIDGQDSVGDIENFENFWQINFDTELVTIWESDLPDEPIQTQGTIDGNQIALQEVEDWFFDPDIGVEKFYSYELDANFDSDRFMLTMGTEIEGEGTRYWNEQEGGYVEANCEWVYTIIDAFLASSDYKVVIRTMEQRVRQEYPSTNFDFEDASLEDFQHHLLALLIQSKIIEYRERDGSNSSLRDAEYAIRNWLGGKALYKLQEGGSINHMDLEDTFTQNPAFVGAYNAGKMILNFVQLGSLMRADDANTNSSPGGIGAAIHGFSNGWRGGSIERLYEDSPEFIFTEPSAPLLPVDNEVPLDFDPDLAQLLTDNSVFLAYVDPAIEPTGSTYFDPEFSKEYIALGAIGPKIIGLEFPIGQGYDDASFQVEIDNVQHVISPGELLNIVGLGYPDGIYEFRFQGIPSPSSPSNFVVGIQFAEAGFVALAFALDSDGDGIEDATDNCTLISNADQSDTDEDLFGNSCDGDFNNDCTINFLDIAAFSNEFLSTSALFDLNNDGAVNFLDFVSLSNSFLTSPGPGLGSCDAVSR